MPHKNALLNIISAGALAFLSDTWNPSENCGARGGGLQKKKKKKILHRSWKDITRLPPANEVIAELTTDQK